MKPGDVLTLRVEKPAAGGRMIARHEGLVVLVSGAIPDETVRARVERAERSLAFATVAEVLDAHPARRPVGFDPRCGGAVYAHVAYDHQLVLKRQVVEDALQRLGRVAVDGPTGIAPSPERGYRMRARLRVRGGRAGFFMEGSHDLCDAMVSGQLLDAAGPAIEGVVSELRRVGVRGEADLELSENIPGDQRAVHVAADASGSPGRFETWLPVEGVTGLTWSDGSGPVTWQGFGDPVVSDELDVGAAGVGPVRLQRHARAFFQGNRFLLPGLVRRVIAACPDGPVIDLYAGVGLFGVALAASGRHQVTAVEGHPASAADLAVNAAPLGGAIAVVESPVERYLGAARPARPFTAILDPPRTGMTREATASVLALLAERVVFVSCDVATFARDLRKFLDAGYSLDSLEGFDLFPNSAHVEVLGVLSRR